MAETQKPGYSLLDHTSDAGLVAWGTSASEAFAQATRGMFAIVLGEALNEASTGSETETSEVEVSGQGWDDLLVNWLAEMVFYFEVDGLVPKGIAFSVCEPPRCAASVDWLHIQDAQEIGGVGIKAITHHQLYVDVPAGSTELRVIFDI